MGLNKIKIKIDETIKQKKSKKVYILNENLKLINISLHIDKKTQIKQS